MGTRTRLAVVTGLTLTMWTSVGSQSVRDKTVEALRSPDVHARKRALQQLAETGHPEDAGAAAALVEDDDTGVQLAALDTLLALLSTRAVRPGAMPGETTSGASGEPRRAFERGDRPARPVPMSAFPPLTSALADRDAAVREHAAYVFAILATSEHGLVPAASMAAAQDAFVSMLDAPEPGLRLAVSRAAGRIFRAPLAGPPPVPSLLTPPLAERLIAAMNRPDLVEQSAAIEALGRAREIRASDALLERLAFHRAEGPVASAVTALEAVARLGPPAGADALQALLNDPWAQSDRARLAILFARQRFFADGSAEGLKSALADPRMSDRARDYLSELSQIR